MSAASRQQRLAKYAAVAIAAWCMAEPLAAVDESVFGTYWGDCTLNNEPVHIDLEIVKNEKYGQGGGADALLFISTKGETPPSNPITLWGGYRDVPQPRRRGDHSPPQTKREFHFTAPEASEAFGGSFSVQFIQEGGQLKGTLGLQPVRTRHRPDGTAVEPAQPASVPLVLSRARSTETASHVVPQPEGPRHLNPDEITGVYNGSLIENKRQFFAQLRVTRKGPSDLSGLLSFSASASNTQPLGSFKLKGKYDPSNQKFQLSSGGELTASDGLILATATGNFEPAGGKIHAQLSPNGGTLELTRNGDKTAELQAMNAESAKRLSQGPASLGEAKSDEERRDVIVRWFNQLKEEYPDIDLHHTVLNEIYPKVLKLYGDDSFMPVFGKPFDAMSADDRNYVKQLMRRLFMGRETRDLLDGFGDFLERPFVLDRGSFSYADVAPQVAFRRAVHQKWRATMDQLATVPSTSAGFDKILSLGKQGTEPFKDLWPSQFKQFQKAVDSAKHRVAEGALRERLDAALSTSSGYDGILKLKETVDSNEELFALASEEVRKREMARVQDRLEAELTLLMVGERQQIDALGSGAGALVNGTQWLRNFHAKYQARFKSSAVVNDTRNYLDQRRMRDLEAGEKEVISLLSSATSAEGVRDVLGQYLGVENDQATEPGKRILIAADERRRAIAWEKEKTKYSERELALMNTSTRGVISVPPNYEPPSAHEIALATLRAFASTGGQVLSDNTATFTPMRRFKNFAYRIQIQHVELNNVEHPDQSPCQLAEAGGYVCQYRLSKTVAIPNFAGSSQDPLLKLNEVLIHASEQAQKLNEPELKKVRFILTPTGWRAPELESEVATLSFDLP
jgi:hypothetical protein